MRKGKGKVQPHNTLGRFVPAPPPSSLATPTPSSSHSPQPSTPAQPSSLTSSPLASLPSDLPGSFPSSRLASPALDSSIADTPSRPASPVAAVTGPSFYFPTPPVSQSSQPAPRPLDFAALSAPPSPSTSTAPAASSTPSSSVVPAASSTVVPAASSTVVPAASATSASPSTSAVPTAPAVPPSTIVISPVSASSSPSQPASPIVSSSQPPVTVTPVTTATPAQPTVPATAAAPTLATTPSIVPLPTTQPTPVPTTAPSAPPTPPMSTMASSATGPGTMPAPRSHNAPYFSGQQNDSLADFLHEYDGLASSLGLSSSQKVDTVLRYVPATTREFWTTLDGYISKDWPTFCTDLRKLYPDTAASSRYTRNGLQEFVRISAQTRIRDENELLLYYRRFLQISNPLRLSNQLSDEVRNAEFFNGFHPRDRDIIYDRLFAIDPRRPLNQTPSIDDTWEAARDYFTHNQYPLPMPRDAFEDNASFSNNRLMEQWFGKEAQDPRPHFQRNQHDRDFYHRPAPQMNRDHWQDISTQQPEYITKPVRVQDSQLPQDIEHLNVSDLILKMHGLSTQDAMYAALYMQCMQRFPEVVKGLALPAMFHPPSSTFTLQASHQTQPQPPAAHPIPNTAPAPVQQPVSIQQPADHTSEIDAFFGTQPRVSGCAFCTQPGHMVH